MDSRDKVKYRCEAKYLLRPGTIKNHRITYTAEPYSKYLLVLTYLQHDIYKTSYNLRGEILQYRFIKLSII